MQILISEFIGIYAYKNEATLSNNITLSTFLTINHSIVKRLLFLILIPATVFSQKQKDLSDNEIKAAYAAIPKVDGQYEWSEVVQADSALKKDDLYRNAKVFFANEFKSAKDVIQYDDRGEGRVMGKGDFRLEDVQGAFLIVVSDKRYVNFTLEIMCKDGRYKYRIYGVSAECTKRASGGSSPDNVNNLTLSMDGAYAECNKGIVKKMDRRLFMATLGEIQSTIADLKKAMSVKKSEDSF